MSGFGVVFAGQSFPINSSAFVQTDPTHWVLDVTSMVNPNFLLLKEVCFFLLAPNSLDANAALGLYVATDSSDWQYRGCVSNGKPSDVFPVQWPGGSGQPAAKAQIGISLEPLAELTNKEGIRLGAKEDFAKRVALDLFRFLESFSAGTVVGPDQLVVPANFLDRWFVKFQNKFRCDPDFLTRDAQKS